MNLVPWQLAQEGVPFEVGVMTNVSPVAMLPRVHKR